MKSYVLAKPGLVKVQETEVPRPGPGDMLVRVKAALTCDTDLSMYRGGRSKSPFAASFGHEFSGVVAGVGSEVKHFREGDEVMGVPAGPCGDCGDCRSGMLNFCDSATEAVGAGVFADYLLLPRHVVASNVYPKPPSLSFVEAALLEPLAGVLHAVDPLRLQPGQTAAVIGAGALGLIHVAYLKYLGLKVVVAERRQDWQQAARTLGADAVLGASGPWVQEIRDVFGAGGADAVFECTGRTEVWEGAVWVCRRGGTVTLSAGLSEGSQVVFDAARLHQGAVSLRGVFHFSPADARKAGELLASNALSLNGLISGEFPLYQIDAALDRLARREGIKYALIP